MRTKLLFLSALLLVSLVTPQNVEYVYGQSDLAKEIQSKVEAELQDETNKIKGKALLLIYSNTGWSGAIQDSSFDSSSRDGKGDAKIPIRCESSDGIYSLSFQKQTEGGYLALYVIQDGKLLDSTATSAKYGVASLAGNCKPSFASGGGCLIATAAFGSELAPQVQFLRNFRDNHILSTNTGSSFMNVFNAWYYSFSPYVADYERQHPWLQNIVKTAIYPLLGILQLSEKGYSSINGEYGALVSGALASSLIGAVYFWPLALSVKHIRQGKFNYKLAFSLVVVALTGVVGSVITGNSYALMVTTSLFVLTLVSIAAILTSKVIILFTKRFL